MKLARVVLVYIGGSTTDRKQLPAYVYSTSIEQNFWNGSFLIDFTFFLEKYKIMKDE